MGEVAARSHPLLRPETTLANTRLLAVVPALAQLLPDQGLRRGSVLAVSGSAGSTSLLLALLAHPMAEGCWAAVVGVPALGIEAAAGLGLNLDHLALVPDPKGHWPEVVAALLDALDLVVISLPSRCRRSDARRLAARARERGAVLMIKEPALTGGARVVPPWPEMVDLQFDVISSDWNGLAAGDGTLGHRQVTVRSLGRRGGTRERLAHLWLPTQEGRLAPWPASEDQLTSVGNVEFDDRSDRRPAPALGAVGGNQCVRS